MQTPPIPARFIATSCAAMSEGVVELPKTHHHVHGFCCAVCAGAERQTVKNKISDMQIFIRRNIAESKIGAAAAVNRIRGIVRRKRLCDKF